MWHSLSTKEVESKLQTDLQQGLSDDEITVRLKILLNLFSNDHSCNNTLFFDLIMVLFNKNKGCTNERNFF